MKKWGLIVRMVKIGNWSRIDPSTKAEVSMNFLERCIESPKILKTLNCGAPTFFVLSKL
jgi:hypothetical protein